MAPSADSPQIRWYDPPLRGILPLDNFHIPKRLQKTIRKAPYAVTVNRNFPAVINACAQSAPGRDQTWINAQIQELYTQLHGEGFAHSIETWRGAELVGGLYGIAIGGAFFGESMFSRATDASKIALVHLAARLKWRGFTLLDTQFINKHLLQFGAVEIQRSEYRRRLKAALETPAVFTGDYSSSAEGDASSSRGSGSGADTGAGAGAGGATAGAEGFSPAGGTAPSAGGLLSTGGTAASAGGGETALVAAFLQSMTQTS